MKTMGDFLFFSLLLGPMIYFIFFLKTCLKHKFYNFGGKCSKKISISNCTFIEKNYHELSYMDRQEMFDLIATCFNKRRKDCEYEFDIAVFCTYKYQIIGLTFLTRAYVEIPELPIFYLESFCVKKEFRKNGVGTRILNYVNHCASFWNILYIDVGKKNDTKLIDFYVRNGYLIKKRPNRFSVLDQKEILFVSKSIPREIYETLI